jgi:trans-aconitate methyltransferase
MSEDFDQAEYWITRHRELQDDPRSVGNLGRSVEENIEGEQQLRNALGILLDILVTVPKSALDLGSGYGRLTPAYLDRGFAYTGVELSPDAVSQARRRFPAASFQVSDLRQWRPSGQTYGIVALMYVLVHFVDDRDWRNLALGAASCVAPGGMLVLADEFSDTRIQSQPHVVLRPFSAYVELLAESGLKFDDDLQRQLTERTRFGRPFRIARRAD